MKINLGCNDFKLDGFINIDVDPVVKPDLVASAEKLPYEDNSVDEIYAGHLLEHFSIEEDVLREWYRVLKVGSRITLTVPDVEKGLTEYKNGTITLDWLNQIVFGATDRTAQNHHQVFNGEILLKQMREYFSEVFILEDSPYLLAKVKWQTIATGIKLH